MRERITILNPSSSHDGVVEEVTDDSVTLNVKPDFLIETRTTAEYPEFDTIQQLRIHMIEDVDLGKYNVFSYNYLTGVSIYAQPKPGASPDEFYDELEHVLEDIEGVAVNRHQWIHTPQAVYFHDVLDSPQPGRTPVLDTYYAQGVKVTKTVETAKSRHLHFFKKVDHYTEIGLFLVDETISSRDDVVLSGLRWVFDPEYPEDPRDLHETLFHIKPRHRVLANSDAATKIVPNGLHPIVKTEFHVAQLPKDDDLKQCRLYYYAHLTRHFIFDKYQSVPSQASLVATHGETNLELPEYAVTQGAEIMFEFPLNYTGPIELTLHSRYQKPDPKAADGVVEQLVVPPKLFYACDVDDDHLLAKSPLDNKRQIGGNYEGYFSEDTVFYHFADENSGGPVAVAIPVAHGSYQRVQWLTQGALVVGTLMILTALVARVFRWSRTPKPKQE
ncbi:hypothetical protein DIURU_004191 [Diutina rugosa]|uniref:Protein PBN1 n=1 Tax=Diutina rugosa TaxID=5481 RepID=A0A642UIQ7_DIURU|nr:uncharacterized protein DIURU_004191 [Diutina rugosa]KAA8899708.1 hypothetical protein DIURU_004191 [Diutina rugosa]